MKKAIVIYFLMVFSSFDLLAQVPNIEWQKCYGGSNFDQGYSILKSPEGGYIFSGWTSSDNGQVSGYHPGTCGFSDCYDNWIIMTDSVGNLQWQKCLGGSGDDRGYSLNFNLKGIVSGGLTGSNDGDVSGN